MPKNLSAVCLTNVPKKAALSSFLVMTLSVFGTGCALLDFSQHETSQQVNSIQEDSLQEMFQKGKQLSTTGRYEEARDLYVEMMHLYPDLPEVYNNLAVVYIALEDFNSAEKALNEALRQYPDYVAAHTNLNQLSEKRLIAAQVQEEQTRITARQQRMDMYCYAIQDVNETEGLELLDLFKSRNIKASYSQNEHTDMYYVVYLDTGNNESLAREYIADLNSKNYSDYLLFGSGSLTNNISMGVFYSDQRAQRYIEDIAYLGYSPKIREFGKTKRTIRINFGHDVSSDINADLKSELSRFTIVGQDCKQLI